jgi:hypothetical protein
MLAIKEIVPRDWDQDKFTGELLNRYLISLFERSDILVYYGGVGIEASLVINLL